MNAGALALGAGARFYARAIDTQQKHLPGVLERAQAHRGTSLVEIFQNCIVYNDNVFGHFTDREVAAECQLHLEHGRPLVFGPDGGKGIRLNPGALALEAVDLTDGQVSEGDLLVHDETNLALAQLLVRMEPPAFPVALGVLYCDPAPVYEEAVHAEISRAKAKAPDADLDRLLRTGVAWQKENGEIRQIKGN